MLSHQAQTLSDHCFFIHHMVCHQNAEAILRYLRVLNLLKQQGADYDVNALLTVKNKDGYDAYQLMVRHQTPGDLYQLLCANVFCDMPDKKLLGMQKEAIFDYMMRLPYQEKKDALQNALTLGHPLYAFFEIKRGMLLPCKTAGFFNKIQTALDVLNAMSMSVPTVALQAYTPLQFSIVPIDIEPFLPLPSVDTGLSCAMASVQAANDVLQNSISTSCFAMHAAVPKRVQQQALLHVDNPLMTRERVFRQ